MSGVGYGTMAGMLIVAILIDILQIAINLFPLVGFLIGFLINPLINLVALVVFWLWFRIEHVDIFGGKNASAILADLVIEITPGFDLLPAWTLWVCYMAWFGKRIDAV